METLDYTFMKYIGVSVDGEEALHSFYLPFLAGRPRVLDLGCGMGGFVKLLCQQGFDAYGVDSDAQCIAEARAHQLPVVAADVVEYLRTVEPVSLDAIFSAHLVEHMPYTVVLETIQLAYRALKPGGRLLVVTPNPRALISHLELYPMHFGHMAMYHPKLLAFFMTYAGFVRTENGENPHTMAAQVAEESPLRALAASTRSLGEQQSRTRGLAGALVLPKPANTLRKLIWYVKMGLVHWLVQPYFDRITQELNQTDAQIEQLNQAFYTTLQAIDRPFECYVIGDKA